MTDSVTRIVRMTFDPARIEDFIEMFDKRSSSIRGAPGCRRLELLRDARFPNVMTTFSEWESEAALEAYRRSDLFRETWALTKSMFADRPEAVSYIRVRRVEGDLSNQD